MAAVTFGHVNSGSTCFSAAIFPDWAELDGQTAQQVGRMAVVLDVREPLSPQAPRDLRARTRGRTGPLPVACTSRAPRSPSSTARSGHGILNPGERFGANRRATRKAADEYGSAPGLTFIKGTVIELDPAGPLYVAIGSSNLRAYVQGQDDAGHAALAN